MPSYRTFPGIIASQSANSKVICFKATASQIAEIASIERAGRDKNNQLVGFQRQTIKNHIGQIARYLKEEEAILPNAIVLGFTDSVTFGPTDNSIGTMRIDINQGPPGLIVDGQQRFNALKESGREDFEVLVSAFVCPTENDLVKQFILVNSAKPLSKSLIYELYPSIDQLPTELKPRGFAAAVTSKLNFDPESSLHMQIKMHTNPEGIIQDTAIQKVIMQSARDGAVREWRTQKESVALTYKLFSDFYGAVQTSFPNDWENKTTRTSRLVHSVGIISLGTLMEFIIVKENGLTRSAFENALQLLVGHTAWSSGEWAMEDGGTMKWNEFQNVSRHIQRLTDQLIALYKKQRKR